MIEHFPQVYCIGPCSGKRTTLVLVSALMVLWWGCAWTEIT